MVFYLKMYANIIAKFDKQSYQGGIKRGSIYNKFIAISMVFVFVLMREITKKYYSIPKHQGL